MPDGDGGTDLSADASAQAFLAAVFAGFLSTMQQNLPGVLDDVDSEFLHDFRVAVRRTRSTLKLGRPALPDDWRQRWEPEFKWLGDLTTPVRDLDVYLLRLPAMADRLVAADATDLAPLEERLVRRRTREREVLLEGLRSARYQRLVADWTRALDGLAASGDTLATDDPARMTAGELAARSIRKAGRRVLRGGRTLDGDSPAEDLHRLRKRNKELRYAIEVFAPIRKKKARKAVVADLKKVQDVLGRFQDTEVQRAVLQGFAEEMMTDGTPQAAVLAMGEVIGHLDTTQDEARRDFDAAFARIARPSSRRRLKRLSRRP